ncbi:MAG: CBS domain-containing protein [Pirellulaceae bacterium]
MDFQLNLDTECVEHAHPSEPLIVAPTTTLRNVLERMKAAAQGSVLICDPGGVLIGILTERDVVRLLVERVGWEVPIEQLMVRKPVTLARRDTVGHAISLMAGGGYRGLPIVDESGRPVGMLSASGILEYLTEQFPNVVYTLPPKPHHSAQEREGA